MIFEQFCGSGYRSSVAARVVSSPGFTDVSDLLGGYEAGLARSSS